MTSQTSQGEKRKRELSPVQTIDSTSTSESHNQSRPASIPRVVGPVAPRINNDKTGNTIPSDSSSDDSDSDFGPQLPPAVGTKLSRTKHEEEAMIPDTSQYRVLNPKTVDPVKRDEWMVVPPSRDSLASGLTQGRRFAPGKSGRSSEASDGPAAAWTESPSQKKIRLENEILGVHAKSNSDLSETRTQPIRTNTMTAKKLKDFTQGEEKRPSLYETHRQRSQNADTDDPSARPFDREKDIAGPKSISNTSRKEMLNRASDYGSRFSGGKYL